MTTTIKDILGLELLGDAKIVAGMGGINNVIKRVSFSDCPFRIEGMEERVIMPGDFFIGSFYIYKDNHEGLFQNIKFYIEYGGVGLCLIDEYFEKLPRKVIDYADKNNFVIFIVDQETPYADLIHDIMESIMIDQADAILEMKIDNLLNGNISKNEIVNTAKCINGNFNNYYSSIYFINPDMDYNKIDFFRQIVNANHERTFLKYKKGIIVIINFEKKEYGKIEIDYILNQMKGFGDSYRIGVSGTFNNIENLDQCLRQAIVANDFTTIIGDRVVYYDNLSLYKILYLLKDNIEFEQMYKELVKPLKDYDNSYNSHLLETLMKFVEMDGDYKETAKELFQHENTIRYRMLKVKKILNLEDSNFKFYEQVSLINKMEKIHIYLK